MIDQGSSMSLICWCLHRQVFAAGDSNPKKLLIINQMQLENFQVATINLHHKKRSTILAH